MTTDQILAYDGDIPAEVHIEDKTAVEQLRLIQQLEEEDRQTIFKLIDKMLTNKNSKTSSRKTSLHCKAGLLFYSVFCCWYMALICRKKNRSKSNTLIIPL
jgi:hypothetical protein